MHHLLARRHRRPGARSASSTTTPIDLVPTILDALGVEPPETIKGHAQSHFDGVSMRYSFDAAALPSARETQFYSMLGSRSIWHDGWKAVTTHPTLSGWSNFDKDTWELYHVDVDRSELHDLAGRGARAPARADQPLVRRGRRQRRVPARRPLARWRSSLTPRPQLSQPRNRYVYYPDVAEVPESQAVNIRNRSYAIGALVDIPERRAPRACCSPTARASAATRSTSRTTGCTTSTASSASSSRRSSPTEELPTGENLILSAAFEKDGEDPPGVATGTLSLFHGDVKVGEGRIKTQPGKFSIAGEGLCVGRDSGDPVTDDYPGARRSAFTGGTINRVAVDVSGEPYVDLEREAVAMMARE